MNSSHFALIRNANLLKCSLRQVLQHLWPHFVCTGSFSGRWQIEHCKSSSTASTNSSSYPPTNGASSPFGKSGRTVRAGVRVRGWKEKPIRGGWLKAILGEPNGKRAKENGVQEMNRMEHPDLRNQFQTVGVVLPPDWCRGKKPLS